MPWGTVSYDGRGLPLSATLPGGASALYGRDALGLLVGVTDPNGGAWQYPRDALGRTTASTDPLGRTAAYGYDSRHRITQETLPGGLGTVALRYDGTSNLTGLTYSDGTDLSYTYDANGRLTAATGVTLARDAGGRIIESNGLSAAYDAEGRIASVTLPGGAVTYRYDGRGLLTAVEDWLGGVTSFSYDGASRLVSMERPNGVTTTYAYDTEGRLLGIEETDGAGKGDGSAATLASTVLERDARGNITRATREAPVALLDACSPGAGRELRARRISESEVAFDRMACLGFRETGRTIGYAVEAGSSDPGH